MQPEDMIELLDADEQTAEEMLEVLTSQIEGRQIMEEDNREELEPKLLTH